MQKKLSWRELLKDLISNPVERERIAGETGVHPFTLQRWANGEAKPREQNLRRLLMALPQQYQDQFRALLEEDSSLLGPLREDTLLSELPPALFNEVLETRASTPDLLRFWAMSRQVLQHALRHLDPEHMGMVITVVRCMPPTHDGRVRSLRESVGLGNAPWKSDLEPKALFLGAESLAGHATVAGYFEQISDLRTHEGFLPAYQTDYEVSAAACPIMYAQRVAGCLLLSSTQPGHFLAEVRRELIRSYANLLAPAFEPEEFYPVDRIALAVMPPLEVQRSYFANFQQRILKLMKETAQTEHPLTIMQAEQLAWQQVEAILLRRIADDQESYN